MQLNRGECPQGHAPDRVGSPPDDIPDIVVKADTKGANNNKDINPNINLYFRRLPTESGLRKKYSIFR